MKKKTTKKIISQQEIDKLHLNDEISIADEVKNKIILLRNELNNVEKNVETYSIREQKKIKRALKKIINKFFSLRE